MIGAMKKHLLRPAVIFAICGAVLAYFADTARDFYKIYVEDSASVRRDEMADVRDLARRDAEGLESMNETQLGALIGKWSTKASYYSSHEAKLAIARTLKRMQEVLSDKVEASRAKRDQTLLEAEIANMEASRQIEAARAAKAKADEQKRKVEDAQRREAECARALRDEMRMLRSPFAF